MVPAEQLKWLMAAGLGSAAASGLLTGAVARYARRRGILDHPNHRSLHACPTPRGGGLAIVAVLVAGICACAALGLVNPRLAAALALGSAAVATVGWVDDRGHVSARVRLTVHTSAAMLVVWAVGGMPELALGGAGLHLGVLGWIPAVLAIVWLTNLYNFMDGIDGLAAVHAVIAGAGAALLLATRGGAPMAYFPALLAGSSLGFLLWNWSPARIFMGDVGSGTVGFCFGALAIATEADGSLPALGWLVILGVFVFDATVTLVRRMLRRERVFEAHRSHAYQRLVQAGWSHRRVSLAAAAAALLLTGIAALGTRGPSGLPFALLASTLLLAACYAAVERMRPMRSPDAARPRPADPEITSRARRAAPRHWLRGRRGAGFTSGPERTGGSNAF